MTHEELKAELKESPYWEEAFQELNAEGVRFHGTPMEGTMQLVERARLIAEQRKRDLAREAPRMSEMEATLFFSIIFRGEHHIPRGKKCGLQPYGFGWAIVIQGAPATYDDSLLTRMVFLAHEKGIRVEISGVRGARLRIALHKREPRSRLFCRKHPTLSQAMLDWTAERDGRLVG
jgi:hypothetical protein